MMCGAALEPTSGHYDEHNPDTASPLAPLSLSFRFGWRRGLLPECDALLLWVFHHALPTGCVKLLLVDGSIIVGIDLRKVHDVRSGICLR